MMVLGQYEAILVDTWWYFFLVVTVMLWFDERGKDTDGGNYTSWSTPNFPTSFWTSPFCIGPVWTDKSFGTVMSYRLTGSRLAG